MTDYTEGKAIKISVTRFDARGIPTRDRAIVIQIDDGPVYRISPAKLLEQIGRLLE